MNVIEMSGAGKRYTKLDQPAMLLRSLLPFARPNRSDLWALRGIDLTIAEGETVGVLGRNGAGKSTLLRMLAGVSRPTEGTIAIRGRIAPLLSVGVGFHQEMSGRENVYVNGMLLGLTHDQVAERFDTIVDFAELHDFIDTPVKFYSSGMFMRLGFAVAIHVDPEVLLVDEVLAVGDLAFQLKCFERMRSLKAAGTTILLVSHSMHAIRLLCPRALLFRHGRLEFDGDSEEAIGRHYELLSLDGAGQPGGATGGVTVLERALLGPHGPGNQVQQEERLSLRLRLRFDQPVDSPQLFFDVLAEDGTLAYEMKTVVGRRHRSYEAGDVVDVEIGFTPRLGGGTYRLTTTVTDHDGRTPLHRDHTGTFLYLAPPLGSAGIADLGATIHFDGELRNDHPSLLLGPSPADALPAGVEG
ncbi:hypothetical protein BH20ACT2_BH20ACT2_26030 [soil metagenome]